MQHRQLASELNKYASGQVIMTVRAPDTVSYINFLRENKEGIVNYILNKRWSAWPSGSSG